MDGALALHLGWMRQRTKAAVFLLAYVGLAAAVVLAWFMAPVLTFTLSGISLLHFGRGDVDDEHASMAARKLARGGLAIAGISQFHRLETDLVSGLWWARTRNCMALFGRHLGCCGRMHLARCCQYAAMPVILCPRNHRFGHPFALTPPLVGFAVYLPAHSARHSACGVSSGRPCSP